MTDPIHVLRRYRITEKAAALNANLNKYTFEVATDANRIEVARAVFAVTAVFFAAFFLWPVLQILRGGFLDAGAEVFDYSNSIPAEAKTGGCERAFGFVPAYIRPLFCEGKGPFRWAALSGDPRDIAATDEAVLAEFPDNRVARPVDQAGRRTGAPPGAAGGIFWR